jgi:acetyltransferase-like isoleucine patch superfamily enzyme
LHYISSKAVVLTKKIGYNNFIMENNVMQPYVEIGNNNIFWSGNHIGHHSIIKNNIFFSSHVVLSGKCIVEDFCWFGVNSCIRDSTTIAEGSFIAMGSVVTKKTKPYKKYTGNPAKEYGDVIS